MSEKSDKEQGELDTILSNLYKKYAWERLQHEIKDVLDAVGIVHLDMLTLRNLRQLALSLLHAEDDDEWFHAANNASTATVDVDDNVGAKKTTATAKRINVKKKKKKHARAWLEPLELENSVDFIKRVLIRHFRRCFQSRNISSDAISVVLVTELLYLAKDDDELSSQLGFGVQPTNQSRDWGVVQKLIHTAALVRREEHRSPMLMSVQETATHTFTSSATASASFGVPISLLPLSASLQVSAAAQFLHTHTTQRSESALVTKELSIDVHRLQKVSDLKTFEKFFYSTAGKALFAACDRVTRSNDTEKSAGGMLRSELELWTFQYGTHIVVGEQFGTVNRTFDAADRRLDSSSVSAGAQFGVQGASVGGAVGASNSTESARSLRRQYRKGHVDHPERIALVVKPLSELFKGVNLPGLSVSDTLEDIAVSVILKQVTCRLFYCRMKEVGEMEKRVLNEQLQFQKYLYTSDDSDETNENLGLLGVVPVQIAQNTIAFMVPAHDCKTHDKKDKAEPFNSHVNHMANDCDNVYGANEPVSSQDEGSDSSQDEGSVSNQDEVPVSNHNEKCPHVGRRDDCFLAFDEHNIFTLSIALRQNCLFEYNAGTAILKHRNRVLCERNKIGALKKMFTTANPMQRHVKWSADSKAQPAFIVVKFPSSQDMSVPQSVSSDAEPADDVKLTDQQKALLKFLERWNRWSFNAPRIKKWGCLNDKNLNKKLGARDATSINNILSKMHNAGLVYRYPGKTKEFPMYAFKTYPLKEKQKQAKKKQQSKKKQMKKKSEGAQKKTLKREPLCNEEKEEDERQAPLQASSTSKPPNDKGDYPTE